MKRRHFLTNILKAGLVTGGFAITGCSVSGASKASASVAENPEIMVYRSPTCECCGRWEAHLEAAGFQVVDYTTGDMYSVKRQYGIPLRLDTCHTASVQKYIIEGHVPADDIKRLLAERPKVAGLVAPGMPIGSPGMEKGDEREPFTVFTFTHAGKMEVFSKHA
ncbi:MAG: DUF411 domain-containing protein [Cyanobacteria bacterium J06627_8]